MRCMIHPNVKPEMIETSYVELDSITEEYVTKGHDVLYCPQCFEDAYEKGKTINGLNNLKTTYEEDITCSASIEYIIELISPHISD